MIFFSVLTMLRVMNTPSRMPTTIATPDKPIANHFVFRPET